MFGNRGEPEIEQERERRVIREDVIVRIFLSVEIFEKRCSELSRQGWRLFSVEFRDDGNRIQIYAVWIIRSPVLLTEDAPFG